MSLTDSGAIVLGWLTKVAVALGLIGLIAFDVISLSVARLGVTDDANAGARAAARAYDETHNVDRAYEAALEAVRELNPDDTITAGTFNISQQGSVSLVVQREAVTIVARYIPKIKDELVLRGDGVATP
jgi:hypothetical protein